MKTKKGKFQPDIRSNYFKIIENSSKTKLFRNFFIKERNKRKTDIIKNGQFACAWYVSTILLLSRLIPQPRLTVDSLEKDLLKNGWKEIKNKRKGAILIWAEKESHGYSNRHTGFYLGDNKAISNNPRKGYPLLHDYKFGRENRKIEKIYWHKNLNT